MIESSIVRPLGYTSNSCSHFASAFVVGSPLCACKTYSGMGGQRAAGLHKEQEDQCQAHVETPQSPDALAPWLQAGDDPTGDMHDARCCVEVSHVINFRILGLELGLVYVRKKKRTDNFPTQINEMECGVWKMT